MNVKHFMLIAILMQSAIFLCAQTGQNDKQNILCIVCEDISPFLRCYGDKVAQTPNIDKLASEGVRFTHMYTTVGVCAPSRFALITGMYPSSLGANHMRNYVTTTNEKVFPKGIEPYEVVLPDGVKCFTEYLRESGYYCTNNAKTDYQFAPPLTAWDENGKNAHWKNRPKDKPFFSIFNLDVTHESKIWVRNNEPLIVNPKELSLPPYYPDDPIVRHDMAVMYSNIFEMDKQVQTLLREIEEAGIADNTIVIFYSDNGGPLPRGKRALYESGTLVPFIVKFPDGFRKGEIEDRFCSFVDIPASVLSLAKVKPPKSMHGKAFMGKYDTKPRNYVYGARNRFDEVVDKMGSVRDKKYRYIRNYMPEIANYLNNSYRLQMPMMKRMIELRDQDSLDTVQKLWFKSPRSVEEFYDLEKDPHEINNLIEAPDYQKNIARLRRAYNTWDKKFNSSWKFSEHETREHFWPRNQQPQVADPEFIVTKQRVKINTRTNGCSIAYQINGMGYYPNHWLIYKEPVQLKKGDKLSAIAVRAGYKNSQVAELEYSSDFNN